MSRKYLRVAEAGDYLEVSPSTIRKWTANGKLKDHRSVSGQRVFYKSELDDFIAQQKGVADVDVKPQIVFYCRSSNGKESLIETQKTILEQQYGKPDKVFTDKSSGLNENRKGLWACYDYAKNNQCVLYVTATDRLSRFGFKYLEALFETANTPIVVVNAKIDKEPHEELMEDFMSLIASFSGKFYRIRGWEQQKRLLHEAQQNLPIK